MRCAAAHAIYVKRRAKPESAQAPTQSRHPERLGANCGCNVVRKRGPHHPILLQLGSHQLKRCIVAESFQACAKIGRGIGDISNLNQEHHIVALHVSRQRPCRMKPRKAIRRHNIRKQRIDVLQHFRGSQRRLAAVDGHCAGRQGPT